MAPSRISVFNTGVSASEVSSRKVVLIVDDDAAIRTLMKRTLQRLGLKVFEASNGRAAISYLTNYKPDLVCLDLVLPELSGFEIITFIRRNRRFDALPVLVISGRHLPEDQAQASEQGASAYLTKPFKPAELEQCVRSLLAANSDPGPARLA
jgi:two-component system chemotaxis response regulator CheY